MKKPTPLLIQRVTSLSTFKPEDASPISQFTANLKKKIPHRDSIDDHSDSSSYGDDEYGMKLHFSSAARSKKADPIGEQVNDYGSKIFNTGRQQNEYNIFKTESNTSQNNKVNST